MNKFTNKQEYLAYRKQWKHDYKLLSEKIRDHKQMKRLPTTWLWIFWIIAPRMINNKNGPEYVANRILLYRKNTITEPMIYQST
jgi:hypothetical protein